VLKARRDPRERPVPEVFRARKDRRVPTDRQEWVLKAPRDQLELAPKDRRDRKAHKGQLAPRLPRRVFPRQVPR
jgi:hypothetical protein